MNASQNCQCQCHHLLKKISAKNIEVSIVKDQVIFDIPNLKDYLAAQATPSQAFWIDIIEDLIIGAGYNYSRIAYRIRCSSSTIQKLATNQKRKPRLRIYQDLFALYYKVFQGPYATSKAKKYWLQKQQNKT